MDEMVSCGWDNKYGMASLPIVVYCPQEWKTIHCITPYSAFLQVLCYWSCIPLTLNEHPPSLSNPRDRIATSDKATMSCVLFLPLYIKFDLPSLCK